MAGVGELRDRRGGASLQRLQETLTSSTEDRKTAAAALAKPNFEQMRKGREEAEARPPPASKAAEKAAAGGASGAENWSETGLLTLMEAGNLSPAGTRPRGGVIAHHTNVPSPSGVTGTAQVVVSKA